MSRKQSTLFHSWASKKESQKSDQRSTSVNNYQNEVVDLLDNDVNDDDLLAMAMEESLKEWNMLHKDDQPSTSAYIDPMSTTDNTDTSFTDIKKSKPRKISSDTESSSFNSPLFSHNQSAFSPKPTSSASHTITTAHLDGGKNQQAVIEDIPGFDTAAGRLWIYPTNYPVRDYQYNIAQQALFKNSLVTLPTGLGKTFIAAVVMYNFYRWYPEGKIIFMAPTKPLVAQQIEACYNIMGIPQTDSAEMTGNMPPDERRTVWRSKRVFYLTPQVMTNDLSRDTCPAEDVKCLVIDEAHKSLGNHAYCQVVRELMKYTRHVRILALSATPGSDIKAVQQVVTNLCISHIELRTEDSIDIRPYVHNRKVEKIVVKLGEELGILKEKYLQIISIVARRLMNQKVLFAQDPSSLSKFMVLKSREQFRQDPPQNIQKAQAGVIEGDFATCMSLYHGYELLQQHGSRSLYHYLESIINGEKGTGRTKAELQRNSNFADIMKIMKDKFDPQLEVGSRQSQIPFATGHPKLVKLQEIVVEHFQNYQNHQDATHDPINTRVIIFSQYRDSVKEITDLLNRHKPMIRVMSFIGQSSAGKITKGFTQKEQLMVMKQFREGGYNTLVCTCVGEEGLDIGDVDLIICFDAHKSPIRLVQRMGRTGRKRDGRIVMLVSEGKEESIYNQSQCSKTKIHKAILNGAKSLQFYPFSPRMIPNGLSPKAHKMHIEVSTAYQAVRKRNNSKQISPKNSSMEGDIVKGSKDGFLTDQELDYWKKNFRLNETDNEATSTEMLNKWMPWQNRKQATHFVTHSLQTENLVELVQFCELQSCIEDGGDNYEAEMLTYLNEEDIIKPGEKDNPKSNTIFQYLEKPGEISSKKTKNKKSSDLPTISDDDFNHSSSDEDFPVFSFCDQTDDLEQQSKEKSGTCISPHDVVMPLDNKHRRNLNRPLSAKGRTQLSAASDESNNCTTDILSNRKPYVDLLEEDDVGDFIEDGDDSRQRKSPVFCLFKKPDVPTTGKLNEPTFKSREESMQCKESINADSDDNMSQIFPIFPKISFLQNLIPEKSSTPCRDSGSHHESVSDTFMSIDEAPCVEELRETMESWDGKECLSPVDIVDLVDSWENEPSTSCKRNLSFTAPPSGRKLKKSRLSTPIADLKVKSNWMQSASYDKSVISKKDGSDCLLIKKPLFISTTKEYPESQGFQNEFQELENADEGTSLPGAQEIDSEQEKPSPTFTSCDTKTLSDIVCQFAEQEKEEINDSTQEKNRPLPFQEYNNPVPEDCFSDDDDEIFESKMKSLFDSSTAQNNTLKTIGSEKNIDTEYANDKAESQVTFSQALKEIHGSLDDPSQNSLRKNTHASFTNKDPSAMNDNLMQSVEEDIVMGPADVELNRNFHITCDLFGSCSEDDDDVIPPSPPIDRPSSQISQKLIGIVKPMFQRSSHSTPISSKPNSSNQFLDKTYGFHDDCQASSPYMSPAKEKVYRSSPLDPLKVYPFKQTPGKRLSPHSHKNLIMDDHGESDDDVILNVKRKRKAFIMESPDTSTADICHVSRLSCDSTETKKVNKKLLSKFSSSSQEEFDSPMKMFRNSRKQSRQMVLSSESTSADTDISSHKPVSKWKKKKNSLLDEEAVLSEDGAIGVSSDETGSDLDRYDASFINNATQCSQAVDTSDMQAVYMRSVKSPVVSGRFKLNYDFDRNINVYSQVPQHLHEEYLEDSFCVEEDEQEDEFDWLEPSKSEITLHPSLINTPDAPVRTRRQKIQDRNNKLFERKNRKENKMRRRVVIRDDSSSDENNPEDNCVQRPNTGEDVQQNVKSEKSHGVISTTTSANKDDEIFKVPSLLDRCKLRTKGDKLPFRHNTCDASRAITKTQIKSTHPRSSNVSISSSLGAEMKDSLTISKPVNKFTSESKGAKSPDQLKQERLRKQKELKERFQCKMRDRQKQMSPVYKTASTECSSPEIVRTSTSANHDLNLSGSVISEGPNISTFESPDRHHGDADCSLSLSFSSPQAEPRNIPKNPGSAKLRNKDRLVLIVDSNEISSATDVVSSLRINHHINAVVRQLNTCDYIVSNRMGIERKKVSDFCNGSNKMKLLDRIRTLCAMFDKRCVIIEKDRIKSKDEKMQHQGNDTLLKTKYASSMISYLSATNIIVLHSQSQEHTAELLAQLCTRESNVKPDSQAICLQYVDLSRELEHKMRFFLTLPRVSYVTAINFSASFRSIQEFINSTPKSVALHGKISEARATVVCNYLRHNADSGILNLK